MIKSLLPKRRLHFNAMTFTSVGGALLLAACASTQPDPTLAVHAAEQAISTADRARVADAASPELSEAREKLTAAQTALHEKKLVVANQLAYESRVDAELASAKFEAAKAQATNEEIRHSTNMLAQEIQRNSGAKK